MDHDETIKAIDDWIEIQKALLSRTHTDIATLQTLREQPLLGQTVPVELAHLPDGPPQITWEWSPFKDCDSAAFHGFPHRQQTYTTGPRPLSSVVNDAKKSLLNPLFDQWDMEWDPALLPPRTITSRHVEGEGRSVVSYIVRDTAAETADVDIDIDDDAPPLPLPITIPPPRSPSPDITMDEPISNVKPKAKTKQTKRKRDATTPPPPPPSPSPSTSASFPATVSHATKSVADVAPARPRPETFKQAWSESEQHLLERLLEEYPDGEKNRWKKISVAMEGRRTPRQVSSRVQKYFAKLKRFGVG